MQRPGHQPPVERADNNPWPQWPRVYRLDYSHEENKAKNGDDPRAYHILAKEFVNDGNGHIKGVKTVEVDWSKPATWGKFPRFAGMPSHEVVQEPGDMLYLPTFYLHFINSIDTNYQCNTRSGREGSREDPTYACTPGFEGNVSPRYRRLQKERGGN